MPSSRGSSQPRDRTHVSVLVAGGFFTTSTTWEAQFLFQLHLNPQLFASLKAMNKLLTMILLWRYPVSFYLKIKCLPMVLLIIIGNTLSILPIILTYFHRIILLTEVLPNPMLISPTWRKVIKETNKQKSSSHKNI